MKAIDSSNLYITGIRSRKDGSLGVSFETPELSSEQKIAWMEMHGKRVRGVFSPLDEPEEEVVVIDKDVDQKSQSQRIRSVLFLLWRQEGEQGEFRDYYHQKTEKYINYLKEKLEE